MAKLTADSFLNVLQHSDLIERDRIKSLMGKMQSDGIDIEDSSAIGRWMISNGHLTDWQVDKLQKGKHKGFRLGKYRLRELLGKGGMSSVYLAEHTLMRRPCAIKVLPIKKVNDSSYLARFFREAQAVASLDHPNIVRAYDIDKEVEKNQEIHFLVMEYVKGRSLHEVVKEDGPLRFEDAAEFCRQAALGLHHAHQSGLVHRDVKPGNLLLDENGVVKVLDLGLARFAEVAGGDEAPLTVAHDEKVLGTADYLSPEQALDSHLVDNRADIYSLGCSMYFALTGQPPFNEGTIAQRLMWHQMKEPPEMKDTRPDIPASLIEIVRRMMAKKPDDRYSTMGEVSTVLLNWLARNASADWKRRHGDLLASSAVTVPTAVPVAQVAAPVALEIPSSSPVPPATPVARAVPVTPAPGNDAAVFPGLPSASGEPASTSPVVSEAAPVAKPATPEFTSPQAAPATVAPAAVPVSAGAADPVTQKVSTEPATDIMDGTGTREGTPAVVRQDATPPRSAPDDTVMDAPVVVSDESTETPTADTVTADLMAINVTEPPAADFTFQGLPGGANPSVNATSGMPVTIPADDAPVIQTSRDKEKPTAAPAPVIEPEGEVSPVTAPVPAAPGFPGVFTDAGPTESKLPDFSVTPPGETAAFPDFSAQQPVALPVSPQNPVAPQPADAVPDSQFAFVPEAVPATTQPVFDPGSAAQSATGFDANAGFSSSNTPAAGSLTSKRPQKKSGPPLGLIAGIVVAIAAIAGGGFFLFGGGDDAEGEGGGQTQTGGGEQTGNGKSGQGGTVTAAGPAKFLGYKLTVGPEGNFKSLAALLKYLRDFKSNYRGSRSQKIDVQVTGGTYAESLVIDNSSGTYPDGIQLVVTGTSPAVLAPTGNGPVVKLTDLENFRLEGFDINASGRDTAVELSGDVDRSILKNVTVSGYSKSGIHCDGATGSSQEEFVLEEVRFNPSGGNSAGMVFAGSDASRFQVIGCRFIGPQNSAIVFEAGANFVTIRDSIFVQTGIGIVFSGVDINLRNIAILNNTFYDCSKAGVHFAAAPSRESFGSSELAIHRNIFSKLGGPEVIVEKGYDLKGFQSFVSSGSGGIQFNWSDRPTAANQTTEWEVVLRPEQRVSSIPFVSTDHNSPDFLRPATQFDGFRPGGGSQRYPGAVQPK